MASMTVIGRKNVFEVALACRGLLIVPRNEMKDFGGACVAFFKILFVTLLSDACLTVDSACGGFRRVA